MVEQKVNYTHANPVPAQLCEDAVAYRWSSARFWQDEWYVGEDFMLDLKTLREEFASAGTGSELKASTESCQEEVMSDRLMSTSSIEASALHVVWTVFRSGRWVVGSNPSE